MILLIQARHWQKLKKHCDLQPKELQVTAAVQELAHLHLNEMMSYYLFTFCDMIWNGVLPVYLEGGCCPAY